MWLAGLTGKTLVCSGKIAVVLNAILMVLGNINITATLSTQASPPQTAMPCVRVCGVKGEGVASASTRSTARCAHRLRLRPPFVPPMRLRPRPRPRLLPSPGRPREQGILVISLGMYFMFDKDGSVRARAPAGHVSLTSRASRVH